MCAQHDSLEDWWTRLAGRPVARRASGVRSHYNTFLSAVSIMLNSSCTLLEVVPSACAEPDLYNMGVGILLFIATAAVLTSMIGIASPAMFPLALQMVGFGPTGPISGT